MTDHGLVIGKFYPPHAGHHLLIRAASRACRRVTVIAMAASRESITLAERVDWLRKSHASDGNVVVTGTMDDLPFDLESETVWRGHVDLMRQALAAIGAPAVSAVFTSEYYGPELARRLGAESVVVDPDRRMVPVSGTAVRADPAAWWGDLENPAREGLCVRIVFVGAESTGTTTISSAVAQHWRGRGLKFAHTQWVPEYGREYTVHKLAEAERRRTSISVDGTDMADIDWRTQDFVAIAARQNALEDEAARVSPLVICDTDTLATGIWHERYMGHVAAALQPLVRATRGRHYIVTSHDGVPFVQDGLRDGESIRPWMTRRFIQVLEEGGHSWNLVRGSLEERVRESIAICERAMESAWRFAAPSTKA